ncbi:hypothetical protein [Azospirillum sp.]|uniref:hypothetical protein n=1 Tax=Azospirillum sp. TaxID=34012 RepID=UPI002D28D78D|nr:hypothetical protein [Azospirillum sp.]HYD66139.1 hypothetical protein [Azospirillum sp.]
MISDRTHSSTAVVQRISAVAPPGSLLKRGQVQPRTRLEVTGRDLDPDYLRMVRECPCLMCGLDPCGEAAHVRFASAAYGKASGLQKKPEDRWALPCCGQDHRVARHAQHNRNEQEFWASLGIIALQTCVRLYAVRGDLVAMRAVVMVAISERTAPPSSVAVPNTAASPASPPRRAHPPRPSIKPEDGGGSSQ